MNQMRRPLLAASAQAKARKGKLDKAAIARRPRVRRRRHPQRCARGLARRRARRGRRRARSRSKGPSTPSGSALEQRERDNLEVLHRPTYELPFLADGVDVGTLYELADLLREQGMA